MATKVVKKTKIKLWNFMRVLLLLAGLFLCCYFLVQEDVHNILIVGTHYLEDDYIIELAGIKNYPDFLLLNGSSISKKVTKSEYISECKVRKKWGFVLELDIVENRPLFFDGNQGVYTFDNGGKVSKEEISNRFRVPRLLNYVPDNKYDKFIKGMKNIQENTLSKISDIEYQPNDYDKDRFLLYMDDGNLVYLTLTKFKMINKYNEVLSQLEGHKGILYLDSGNHFQIKE